MSLLSNGPWNKIVARGNRPALIGLTFNTDGSGVPTIVDTNYGRVTVTQSEESGGENDFVVTIGAFKTCFVADANSNKSATINITTVADPAAGTIELQCSASLQSAQVRVWIFVGA